MRRWMYGGVSVLLLMGMVLGVIAIPAGADGAPVNVSRSAADSRAAAVAVTPAGTVHVVWEEPDGLYHARLANGTWSNPVRISVDGRHPALWVDRRQPDVVYLAWDEPFGNARDVFVRRWQNGAWSLPRNVSQTDGYAAQPAFAQRPDGTLILVWSDTTPGTATLYRAVSTDGDVWTSVTPLNALVGTSPRVVLAGGNEHLIWLYRPSFREPRRLMWSRNDGSGWTLPEILSTPTRSVEGFAVHVQPDGTLWVAWNEVGDLKTRAWQLGQGWNGTATVTLGASGAPAFAAPGSFLFLFWSDGQALHRALWEGTWRAPQAWWTPERPVTDVTAAAWGAEAVVAWSQQGTAWDVWVGALRASGLWTPYVLVR